MHHLVMGVRPSPWYGRAIFQQGASLCASSGDGSLSKSLIGMAEPYFGKEIPCVLVYLGLLKTCSQ